MKKGRERAFPALLRVGMAGAFGCGEPTNRKESMQTSTEQPQSSNPEAPPARQLRTERIVVAADPATDKNDVPTFTAAERAAWFRMARLLDEVRAEERAIAPPTIAPPFRCGILWPPRDNDWLSGRAPEEVAEQGRLLERAVWTLEGTISPKLLRAELSVAKCAQSRADLRACRKWKNALRNALSQHP